MNLWLSKTGRWEPNMSEEEEIPVQTRRKQLVSCGVGQFGNGLVDLVLMSFGLIYYMKVAELSSWQAGLILVTGQIATFIANPIFGYCCDRLDVPLLSHKLGRRKSWHLMGTIFTSIFFVLAFSPCFVCRTSSSSSTVKFVYFLCAFNLASFCFGAVDIAHSSIIPEVTKNQEESIIVNSIIRGMTYGGGLFVYALVWILLRQSDEDNLSPNHWQYFTEITVTLTVTGGIFVIVFQVWTVESKKRKTRRVSTTFKSVGLLAVSLLSNIEDVQQSKVSVSDDRVRRKSSRLRKISQYFMPFDAEIKEGTFSTSRKVSSKSMQNPVLHKASTTPTISAPDMILSSIHTNKLEISRNKQAAEVCVWTKPEIIVTVENAPNTTPAETRECKEGNVEGNEGLKVAGVKCDFSGVVSAYVAEDGKGLPDAVDSCHVHMEETEEAKSIKDLLKDPGLYKVTFIYVCGFGLEEITYSYLALYLMDHLHFEKEAAAYFALVFLLSAICGTVTAKQLSKVLGKTWTHIIASIIGLGAAAWFYFTTQSYKQMAYGATVFSGLSVSALTVTALSAVADFARDDVKSAGFAYSFAAACQEIICGLLFLVIQQYYPSDNSTSCVNCGEYIRFVYSLTLGFHALLSLVAAVSFHRNAAVFTCKARDEERQNTTNT